MVETHHLERLAALLLVVDVGLKGEGGRRSRDKIFGISQCAGSLKQKVPRQPQSGVGEKGRRRARLEQKKNTAKSFLQTLRSVRINCR